MKDEKKDEYQKALAAFGESVKAFRQGKNDRAEELLQAFMEKHGAERELVDRARTYLKIIRERVGKPGERLTARTDEEGREHPMPMGCYGLGIGRTVAGAIEEGGRRAGARMTGTHVHPSACFWFPR